MWANTLALGRLDFLERTPTNKRYYGGALAPDGRAYFATYGAQYIGIFDPEAGVQYETGADLQTSEYGWPDFVKATAVASKIFFTPWKAPNILVLDTAASGAARYDATSMTKAALGWSDYNLCPTAAAGDRVFMLAQNTGQDSFIIDANTNQATVFTAFGQTPSNSAYESAVYSEAAQKIFALPWNADHFAIIDVANGDAVDRTTLSSTTYPIASGEGAR